MEDWKDLGPILDLLDNEVQVEQRRPEEWLLYEELKDRLKNNPFYLFIDSLVTDVKTNFDDWTEKELPMSWKLERARRNKEISALPYDGGSEGYLAHFFLDAFVHIEAGRRGWARWVMICIRGADKYAKQCEEQGFPSDYLKGVDYLSRWMLLHIYLNKGKVPPGGEHYDAWAEFECLPDSGKALVLAPKAFLLGSFQNKSTHASKQGQLLMKEMVQLDSASAMWPYTLGNWLRTCRRRLQDPSMFGPGPDEILMLTMSYEAILVKANSSIPEATINNSKDVALSAVCQLVAEIIKAWDQMTQTDFSVKIGDVTFDRNSGKIEIMEFLFDNLKKLNSKEKDARYKLPVLIRSAEILCNSLPPQYRDYKVAEDYLLQALKIKPNKSKVLHKLGVLYLISKKHCKIDKALDFFRRAVEAEPKNFPALSDLILTLMGQPEMHKVEVERCIEKVLDDFADKRYDVQHQKGRFHFFDGCLKFMLGERMDAVRLWVEGQTLSPTENFFLMIAHLAGRYHWNIQMLHFSNISTALQEYSKISSSPSFDADGFVLLMEKFKTIRWTNVNSGRQDSYTRHQYQVPRECDTVNNWRSPSNSLPNNWNIQPLSRQQRIAIGSSPPSSSRLTNSAPNENQDSNLPINPSQENQPPPNYAKYIPPGRRNKDGHGAGTSLNI